MKKPFGRNENYHRFAPRDGSLRLAEAGYHVYEKNAGRHPDECRPARCSGKLFKHQKRRTRHNRGTVREGPAAEMSISDICYFRSASLAFLAAAAQSPAITVNIRSGSIRFRIASRTFSGVKS